VISVLRFVALAALALIASGCGAISSLFEKGPPLEQYQLVVPRSADAAATRIGPPALQGTLSIAPYVTRGIYDDDYIVYRIDDTQLAAYTSKKWAIPLSEMLGTVTQELLERRPLTAEPAVFDPRLPRASTYRWRGTVRELEEVNRAQQVLAAVHLDVEIVRTVDDSVVWRGSQRVERAVPEPTRRMTSVVNTLSEITAEALTKLIDEARTELGLPAAASARPPD
jgi:uncharacterized lipoprotein YmbA